VKYTELPVWQASTDLAQSVFALTAGFRVEQRLALARRLAWIDGHALPVLAEQTDKVGRMLSRLTTSLKGR
jgi:hypothetical protein